METKSFEDLKPNPKNPRRMSKHDGDALRKSIMEFGDLSCIVFNVQTQQMVGGHQRLEIMKQLPAEHRISLNEQAGKGAYEGHQFIDDVGTVSIGYIWIGNKQFAYREVNWPYEKELAANIAANRIQGEFDLDLLAEANQLLEDTSADLLAMTGQTETELLHLKKMSGAAPDPEPKNDDGGRKLEFRLSEVQVSLVEEAIGTMKRNRNLTMESNPDLTGNAIYYICEQYLQSEPLPAAQP